MLGLLQLLLFLLLFGNSHCDLITIKKVKDVVACLTNNYTSAVAFVKRPDGDKDFTKVDYSDGEGKSIPLSKYDCDLVTGNCTQWNWKKRNNQGWYLASEVGGAITDYRWNDLPTYFVNGTSLSQMYIISHRAPFHFSFLAEQQAENKIHERNKWSQFENSAGNDVFTKSDVQLNISFNRTSCTEYAQCELKLEIYGRGLLKIHKYNYLFSYPSTYSSMELEVLENAKGFCADVVFLSAEASNKAFDLTITQGEKPLQHYALNASREIKNKWVTMRFENNTLTLVGKWKLTLTAGPGRIRIGGIKFCAGGDSMVKPKGKNMESCHLLAESEQNLTTKERLLEVASNSAVCHALGEDCSTLKACRENGECVNFTDSTSKESDSKKTTSTTQPPPPPLSETTITTQATSTKTKTTTSKIKLQTTTATTRKDTNKPPSATTKKSAPTSTTAKTTTSTTMPKSKAMVTVSTITRTTQSTTMPTSTITTTTASSKTEGSQETTPTFQEPIINDSSSNSSSNISCDEANKKIRDMVILTTSWNIGSFTFLAFQLFYYRYLRRLDDSIHLNRRRLKLPTPSPQEEHDEAETYFSRYATP